MVGSGRLGPAEASAPVTELQLWRLAKGRHVAEAYVRGVSGIGVELRLLWNGELRASQVYRVSMELEAAAEEKRRELEAKGWERGVNVCLGVRL
jgi:hypothetical protein